MSKQPPPAPTASTVGPCPTLIQISRTPRHWRFTQHHRITRLPLENLVKKGSVLRYKNIISSGSNLPLLDLLVFRLTHHTRVGRKSVLLYSRLSLSRSRRDPLTHFEISVRRHSRNFAELRKILMKQPNFINEHVTCSFSQKYMLEIYIENVVKKGRNFSSYPHYFVTWC